MKRTYKEKPKYGHRQLTAPVLKILVALLCFASILYGFANAIPPPGDGRRLIRALPDVVDDISQPFHDITRNVEEFSILKCTAKQAAYQVRHLAAAKVRGCPPEDDVWMRLVHLLMPKPEANGGGIFIDIGSNKGYTAARWYQLWNQELGLTPPKLYAMLRQVSTDKQVRECGACGDCHEDKEPFTSLGTRLCGIDSMKTANGNLRHSLKSAVMEVCTRRFRSYKPIRVYLFDGNSILVDAVNTAKEKLGKSDSLNDNSFLEEFQLQNAAELIKKFWSIELAAFSDEFSTGKTMTFIQNGELGHLLSDVVKESDRPQANQQGKEVQVPVLTVDALVMKENIRHIDFLKIDTEGHDMTVLEGAESSLEKGIITIIMFEYNEFWPKHGKGTNASSLKYVINTFLAPKNYICYLEGKNVMVRLSHCWNDNLDALNQWSNVWCANAKTKVGQGIISVFDSYSLAFT